MRLLGQASVVVLEGLEQVWRVRTRGKRVSEIPQNLGGEVAEGSG